MYLIHNNIITSSGQPILVSSTIFRINSKDLKDRQNNEIYEIHNDGTKIIKSEAKEMLKTKNIEACPKIDLQNSLGLGFRKKEFDKYAEDKKAKNAELWN